MGAAACANAGSAAGLPSASRATHAQTTILACLGRQAASARQAGVVGAAAWAGGVLAAAAGCWAAAQSPAARLAPRQGPRNVALHAPDKAGQKVTYLLPDIYLLTGGAKGLELHIATGPG